MSRDSDGSIGCLIAISFWLIVGVINGLISIFDYLTGLPIDSLAKIIIWGSLGMLIVFTIIILIYARKFYRFSNLLDDKLRDRENKVSWRERELTKQQDILNERELQLKALIKSTTPFKDVADMAETIELSIFSDTENNLRTKSRPAYKAAEEVKRMRGRLKDVVTQSKENAYKLHFILKAFPDLEYYLDNEDVSAITEFSSIAEFENDRDKTRDYLSDEEFRKLSTSERNQLALDRYIQNRNKSKWMIGRDYELSCAWLYEQKGCHVIRNGIEAKLNDHGRDLIITNPANTVIWIVQCKYWASSFEIHENVIMQLFGSKVAFDIENNLYPTQTKAVLMVPNFSVITDTAMKFAKNLGVEVIRNDMTDYPRIKCNVNGESKIYHLPFDQQYDRTKIEKSGEFYAKSIVEAESKGFRRAMRHQF